MDSIPQSDSARNNSIADLYHEYINSDAWRIRRRQAMERAGHRCQLCSNRKKIRVHHNSYENLGNEKDEDLIVLCERCHKVYHVHVDKRTSKKMKHLAESTPKRVDALPRPPRKSKVKIIDTKQINPLPAGDATGNNKTIVVTREYMNTLMATPDSITYRGLRLVGEPIPWQNGWKHRPIGRTVVVDEGELAAEQELVKQKKSGEHARIKAERRRFEQERVRNSMSFDPSELQTIVDMYREKKSLRKISRRFSTTRGVIKEVISMLGRAPGNSIADSRIAS